MIGHSKNFMGTDFSSAFISQKLWSQVPNRTLCLCSAAFISLGDSLLFHLMDFGHLDLDGIFSRYGYDPACNGDDCLINLRHMSSCYIALAYTNWTAHFFSLHLESISFPGCSSLAASFIKSWRRHLGRDQCRGWSTAERTCPFQAWLVKLFSYLAWDYLESFQFATNHYFRDHLTLWPDLSIACHIGCLRHFRWWFLQVVGGLL